MITSKIIALPIVLSLCSLQAAAQVNPSLVEILPQLESKKEDVITRKMSSELIAIASAKQLEEASLKSGKMATAVNQIIKQGASTRADLEWIIANGTPAGRLYATAILNRFDAVAAKDAYKALAVGMGDVSVEFVGTKEHCHYSVGDIVVDQTSARPLIEIISKSH